MNTGYVGMGPNSSQASNIPLPPGTPPPINQHPQQQHYPQQHQQQSTMPVFGVNANSPLTFASLARTRENVVESTLHQYGPGPANQMQSAMSRMMPSSTTATMSSLMGQQQQINLRHQQQQQLHQQQLQQQHLHRQQQIRMAYQTSQQFQTQQQQQQHLLQSNPVIRHNTVQIGMARPPVYLTNTVPLQCQTTPVSSVPTYHLNLNQNPSVRLSNPSSNITSASTNQASNSQPSASISPPLDAIRGSNHPNDIVIPTPPIEEQQQQSHEQRDRPAAPKKDCMAQAKENWEKWTVNEMMQEYRKLSQELEKAQSSRANLEREINDIVRKNPGQNVELDPVFLRKKQDQTTFNLKCEDINRAMKFVGDKCNSKYGRKLENSNSRQPLHNPQPAQQAKKQQRARMSTGRVQPEVPKFDSKDKKNLLLELKDTDLWCQACDCLFDSLKEFCDHLHKREHKQNMDVTVQPPWRHHSSPKRQITKFTTFSLLKGICAEVNNTSDIEFTMRHLDAALNPSIKDVGDLAKLSLNRDRKEFDDNDRLFTFKGYDELVPINGYYCKLCDRTLCDETEVEKHLKGYTHNYEHTKSVALQASHERDFRLKMERSIKAHKDKRSKNSDTASNKTKETTSKQPVTREPSPSTSNGLSSHWSARLPYKKPTSRIVDEHDIIADKFEKRKEKEHVKTGSSEVSKNTESTKLHKSPTKLRSPKRHRDRAMPEIVPVSDNQPSASLKRLKRPVNEKSKEKPVAEQSETQKKTSDEIPIITHLTDDEDDVPKLPANKQDTELISTFEPSLLEEVHLERGDPDSPFPELDIYITGNVPVKALKDPRLRTNVQVRMNRINLDDYKHMLFDRSSMWARVDRLMTKKEPGEYENNLDTGVATAPLFFDNNGETIPVSVDRDGSDFEDKDFKISDLQDFFCADV